MTKNKEFWLASLCFCIGIGCFFKEVLFSGQVIYGVDFIDLFYPLKEFIRSSLARGEFPLWNPYLFSGTPVVANIQAGLFYPFDLPFWFCDARSIYNYSIFLHLYLAFLSMFYLLRQNSIGSPAAILGSIVFVFNGFVISRIYAGHWSPLKTYAWLPLFFLLWQKFLYTKNAKYAALTSIILGFMVLAGFPPFVFYIVLIALFYTLGWTIISRDKKLWSLLAFVIMGLGGLAIAAIQLFPTYELSQLSTRKELSIAMATADSLRWQDLVGFFIPNPWGIAVDSSYSLKPFYMAWEANGYCSVVAILLLPMVPFKRKLYLFFAMLLLFSLAMASGKHSPLYLLFSSFPIFENFRAPVRFILISVFCLSFLAAIGFHNLLMQPRIYKIWSAFAALLGIALALPQITDMDKNFYQQLQVYALFGALFSFLILLFVKKKITTGILIVLTLALLSADLLFNLSRLITSGNDIDEILVEMEKSNNFALSHKKARILSMGPFPSNYGPSYRWSMIAGYDTLILKKYVEFVLKSQGKSEKEAEKIVYLHVTKNPKNKMGDLLNIGYIAWSANGKIWFQRQKQQIPRAFVVNQAKILAPDKQLSYMASARFSPKKEVVLDTKPNLDKGKIKTHHITWQQYQLNKILLQVETDAAGFLVLNETFYPGWQAYINGKKTKILNANYTFRALALPKGKHQVLFRYSPFSFWMGATTSVFALITLLLLLFWKKKKTSLVKSGSIN